MSNNLHYILYHTLTAIVNTLFAHMPK